MTRCTRLQILNSRFSRQRFQRWRDWLPILSITGVVGRISSGPTRLQVLALVALIWAGIFLPGLGSTELKHEEPRRALPAVHMLASGDWLVPRVGNQPYLRKPPMLQWLISFSILATGSKSEWAVRLPSALATLALALTIGGLAADWLGTRGSLLAAIFFLTNLAILETGRLAELEAVYVGFSGIGLVIWVSNWLSGSRGWRLWIWPALFLSLAMLTKGPTHLIFFYGIAIPVLIFAKDLRALGHPAHWCALALVAGSFVAWALPCSLAVGEHDPIGVWRFWIHQLTSRAAGSETQHFHLAAWLLSLPMTLKNFLPWTPLLIFLWPRKALNRANQESEPLDPGRTRAWFLGARFGMIATCAAMSLLPNGSPRYIYPLFVVPCLLLAQVLVTDRPIGLDEKPLKVWKAINAFLLLLAAVATLSVPFLAGAHPAIVLGMGCCAVLWVVALITCKAARRSATADLPTSDGWLEAPDVSPAGGVIRQALTTAFLVMIGAFFYAMAIVPRVNSVSYGAREVAIAIQRDLPAKTTLWVQEEEYRPLWYYLEPNVKYFLSRSEIAPDASYFVLPKDKVVRFTQDLARAGWQFDVLTEVADNEQRKFTVLRRRF
jgi:4-amino-4-deoxy-L-arabinose transferase-like glycosyltransferase